MSMMWSRSGTEQQDEQEALHRKRVTQILRYISTMSSSATGTGNVARSFVRTIPQLDAASLFPTHAAMATSYAAGEAMEEDALPASEVLFTIADFQRLALLCNQLPGDSSQVQQGQQTTLPFSFYTRGSGAGMGGSLKKNNATEPAACWLRLTRVVGGVWKGVAAAPPPIDEEIKAFLKQSAPKATAITMEQLDRLPPTSHPKLQRWVRRQRRYLQAQQIKKLLEPMYNHLFEWYHQKDIQADLDLIWGLGQAKYLVQEDDGSYTLVDGPLLEIRVEVELARDGALLVRPKEHTGVSLNQTVVGALGSNADAVRQLRQSVEALDVSSMAPGEPSTYTMLLKRMAVELSAGGTFQSSKTSPQRIQSLLRSGQLVVTDAWCLYSAPRPTAVWARDALALVESISNNDKKVSVSPNDQLPRALWALTHGPGALDPSQDQSLQETAKSSLSVVSAIGSALGSLSSLAFSKSAPPPLPAAVPSRPRFPLPTSDAQNRIADLLLTNNYPAVVCEGPPGTGKTHTIANIVCAYLSQGKRVLVTSKGAPALSVLRERLPACVQELCVDVSMSESTGMRQLQQTVERLANKVAWVNTEREVRRSEALQTNIGELETELKEIDARLGANAEERRTLVQTISGQEFFEQALELIETAPWLMKTIAHWEADKVKELHDKLQALVVSEGDPMNMVTGYPTPPSDALVSLAASNAGLPFSYLKNATKGAIASVPLIGSRMADHCSNVKQQLEEIRINENAASRREDWYLIFQALERKKAVSHFYENTLRAHFVRDSWPEEKFVRTEGDEKYILPSIVDLLDRAYKIKVLVEDLELGDTGSEAAEFETLDKRRVGIASHIQTIAEDLVSARVIGELSKNFSAEAQSALVTFAQVSGKAKFGKASQTSKMTQRQRRKRQEYLTAFEKCVRYIPCWILTTSQISDYLPAECLFDLVVIDEASQSDVTVLPGMMRGKQWLIVGDGKQVSPTESFVAEEQIEMLKAALPESPFEASMLPGHSFFDLCAQAYPRGRIILREHFRCAPEIISFSNHEYYNGNLVPLRLPTSTERLKPSLVDIRIRNGQKTGKINEQECDEIVRQIKAYVESCTLLQKRSIGVISLVGDEQSRLIRGRLLDQIGPHKYKLHDILVGEPPSFQGAERDIVFLSMVCSPRSVVTQNQLMHAQRINVALSRARDRMVLVRSIDTNHIPNEQDVKFAVLDFFERAKHNAGTDSSKDGPKARVSSALSPFRARAESLLKDLLERKGYATNSMGVVWDNAICIEDATSSRRAAICVEATGESSEDWKSMLEQQKSIERVGWKCLRVDAVYLLTDYIQALGSISKFLASVDVHPGAPKEEVKEEKIEPEDIEDPIAEVLAQQEAEMPDPDEGEDAEEEVAVVISSEEDNDIDSVVEPPKAPIKVEHDDGEDNLDMGATAADYGNVAGLDFLRGANMSMPEPNDDEEVSVADIPSARVTQKPAIGEIDDDSTVEEMPPPPPAVVGLKRKAARATQKPNSGEMIEGDFTADEMRAPPPPAPVGSKRKRAAARATPVAVDQTEPKKPESPRKKKRKPPTAELEEQYKADLLEKQKAVAESTKRTFANDDLSGGSSDEDFANIELASIAPSVVSNRSKRRRRLDRYSRDPRYYVKPTDVQDDISHAEYMDETHPEPPAKKQPDNEADDGYEEEVHSDDESYREEF
eukprot:Nitzschia sp. Nitz4//scaffold90_size81538//26232//31277//NITZ4_005317-RA/size81538-processed-gene-0.34-mRNA-1//1//CDS//3329560005//6186//frame0